MRVGLYGTSEHPPAYEHMRSRRKFPLWAVCRGALTTLNCLVSSNPSGCNWPPTLDSTIDNLACHQPW